jgi:16S rRNA (guanine966-N2)-methyltransferase
LNIRIISGEYGGRKIEAPDNDRTHPMGERIRNALFNSIGTDIEGATVLDAFAGTGAIGLEALSRGAKQTTFIEKDRVAQKILTKNVTSLGLEGRSVVVRTTVHNWVETAQEPRFDFIFADPPYHDPQLSTAEKLFDLLLPNGLMVLSHPGRGEAPTRFGFVVVDNRSYGNAVLTFYRRDAA